MRGVYILDVMRTPLVKKNGVFAKLRPEILGAEILKYLTAKHDLLPDIVFAGNAAGTGGNMARLMLLEAGLPAEIPACTIDMQCASGAAALALACQSVASGQSNICVAGGMESASLQPIRAYRRQDERFSFYQDGVYKTAQFAPGQLADDIMLQYAEKIAQQEKISRSELDEWALKSHRLAALAAAEGRLQDYILPVDGQAEDDGIRKNISEKFLARLPGLFGRDSLTTAGTACLIHAGAAFALLGSEEMVRKGRYRPLAKVIDTLAVGIEPERSPLGAMLAAEKILARNGLSFQDMAAVEFNESFAVIDVLLARKHPEALGSYNLWGGALAYGHPYGASGAVLLVHLLARLKARGGYGLLAIAGAGGMGEAVLVEAVE